MMLNLIIAALILLNAIFILLSTLQAILAITNDLAAATGADGILRMLEGREAMFGAINILLCVAAVFIGVIKPRFGGKAS